ncbi:MAG TPA: hypothetical protein VGK14_10585 [Novimethylophilus sp.]|jgi:hydrogenase-4 membrane subunit HyfE|uniref:hypothetical protein n=1 Tax=Novimethylophilus sp. TaxID=2137426 RepID=UPI002F4280EC
MQLSSIDIAAACAAFSAIWLCGLSRLPSMCTVLAVQTLLLAAIAGMLGFTHHDVQYLVLAGVVLAVKAIAIPLFLVWTARRLAVHRDIGMYLHPSLVLFCGCIMLAVGFFLAPQLAARTLGNPGAAGMALTLLLIGMLVMITRRLALSQVIGFLVLENGVFLYGLTQSHGMPLIFEMGVIFDVLVGVMIAGLVIFRLNRSFEHIDVTALRGLRH